MAKQTINVGTIANDNTGDTLRVSFTKVNANFTELYTNVATVTSDISTLSDVAFSGSYTDLLNTPTVVGASDRLVNGSKEIVLGANGTLTVPSPTSNQFPTVFSAANYVPTLSKPTLTLTGTPWALNGQYVYAPNGETQLALDNMWPTLVNPGYTSGDTFTFDSTVHGIADFVLTIQLNDVVEAGPAGWTANVAASQPPVYASTVKSLGAVKVTANNSSWIFGTDGTVTFPYGHLIGTGEGDMLIRSDGGITLAHTTGTPNSWDSSIGIYGSTVSVTSGNGAWNFGNNGTFYGPLMGGLKVAGYIEADKGNGLWLSAGAPNDVTQTIQITNTDGATAIVYIDLAVNPNVANIPSGAVFSPTGNAADNLTVNVSGPSFDNKWELRLNGIIQAVQGASYNVTYPGTVYNNVSINALNGNWTFGSNGTLTLPVPNNLDFNNPSIRFGGATSVSTNNYGFSVPGPVAGVVYNATTLNLASMKLLITIEGLEDAGDGFNHTQVCEMLVVRRVGATSSTVDSVVYGVIHTSLAPLAILTTQQGVDGRVEILAQPTNTTPIYVKVHATEVRRGD